MDHDMGPHENGSVDRDDDDNHGNGRIILTRTVILSITMTMPDNVMKVSDHENGIDHERFGHIEHKGDENRDDGGNRDYEDDDRDVTEDRDNDADDGRHFTDISDNFRRFQLAVLTFLPSLYMYSINFSLNWNRLNCISGGRSSQ